MVNSLSCLIHGTCCFDGAHVYTTQGLGLTEQRNIKRDDSFTYKATSISSSVRKDSVSASVRRLPKKKRYTIPLEIPSLYEYVVGVFVL